MYEGRMIFSQLLDFVPRYEFERCVRTYRGNYRIVKASSGTEALDAAREQRDGAIRGACGRREPQRRGSDHALFPGPGWCGDFRAGRRGVPA